MQAWLSGLLATGLLALTVWALTLGLDAERMPLRSVMVRGELQHVDRLKVQRVIAPHLAQGFFQLPVGTVHRRLLEMPWVASATLRRQWPDTLVVHLVERQAVARWLPGGLLDAKGERFVPKGAVPGGLPLLAGPAGSETRMLERFYQWSGLLAGAGHRLVRLGMDERQAWRLELASGLEIIMGRRPNEGLLADFLKVLPTVSAASGSSADRVDLRYTNGFAVKWRLQD